MDLATFRRRLRVSARAWFTLSQKDWFPASVSSAVRKGWCPGEPGVCELRTEVPVIKVTVSVSVKARDWWIRKSPPTPVNTL